MLYLCTEREVRRMFITILKKDMKRKKTMNLILLLFIILSAMFAASAVNNIVSVLGGLDYYFDKAGIADYMLATSQEDPRLDEILDTSEYCQGSRREPYLSMNTSEVRDNDGKKIWEDVGSNGMIASVDRLELKLFDKNNEPITKVEKGKVYFPVYYAKKGNLQVGDIVELRKDGKCLKLEYAGLLKDAFLGSNFMGNPRFLLNDEDYQSFISEDTVISYMYYIDSNDTDKLAGELSESSAIMFSGDRALIKLTYMLDIMISGIMLAVSICLLLVSFAVLRFSISFTVNEEFREIGVMKALGLKNNSIRTLYLVKYLGIAIIGAVIGFFASIPFGKQLLMGVSDTIVLGNDNDTAIGIACAGGVVLLIIAFCWGCTRKIKTLSPIDAVRSGQTGERFRRKGLITLSGSKMSAGGFLPLNDVLSAPKTYAMLTVIFAICMMLVMMLATAVNTLRSGSLAYLLSCTESDLYISTDAVTPEKIASGSITYGEEMKNMEKKLADNGIPAKVTKELGVNTAVEAGDKNIKLLMFCNKDIDCSEYEYTEGTAPQNIHEIALSEVTADDLDVGVGDKVKVTLEGKTNEYMVTAKFVTMNQAGSMGRFYQDMEIDDANVISSMEYQIDFDDDPDEATILERKQQVMDIFGVKTVYTAGEFVDSCTNSSSMIETAKNIVLIISIVIIILISVLMERSFISKEKSEIALMKALGFKSRSVSAHHSVRFMICGIAAGILACALCIPFSKLVLGMIFSTMGAVKDIRYAIKPLELFVIYPLILTGVTILGASVTALYTRTIKASDAADIE